MKRAEIILQSKVGEDYTDIILEGMNKFSMLVWQKNYCTFFLNAVFSTLSQNSIQNSTTFNWWQKLKLAKGSSSSHIKIN